MERSAGLVTIFNRGRENGRGNHCSCRRVAVRLWPMAHHPQYAKHTALVREAKRIWFSYSSVRCHSSSVFMSVPFLLWLALAFAIKRTAAGIGNAKSS